MIPQFGSHEWLTRSAGRERRTAREEQLVVDLQRVGAPRLVERVELGAVDDVAAESGDGGARRRSGCGREDSGALGAGRCDRRVRSEPRLMHDTSRARNRSGTLPVMAEISVFELVGGQPFFDALVERFYERVEARSRRSVRSIPRTSHPGKRALAMFLAQYWGGPPDVQRREGPSPACACGTRRSPSASAATRRVARGDARRPRRGRRARGGQDAMREYFDDGRDRDDQQSGATMARDEQAAAEGEAGAAAGRVASRRGTGRRGPVRAGRLSPDRPVPRRDPAPAVRARRARARARGPARRVRRSHARRRVAPRARCCSSSRTRCGSASRPTSSTASATRRASRAAATRARCTTRASRSRCARR